MVVVTVCSWQWHGRNNKQAIIGNCRCNINSRTNAARRRGTATTATAIATTAATSPTMTTKPPDVKSQASSITLDSTGVHVWQPGDAALDNGWVICARPPIPFKIHGGRRLLLLGCGQVYITLLLWVCSLGIPSWLVFLAVLKRLDTAQWFNVQLRRSSFLHQARPYVHVCVYAYIDIGAEAIVVRVQLLIVSMPPWMYSVLYYSMLLKTRMRPTWNFYQKVQHRWG